MPRRTVATTVVLAALALPAAAGAVQPRVDLKVSRDAPPAFRYTSVATGFKGDVLVELQYFARGKWRFAALLEKGVTRKRLRVRRARPEAVRYRVRVTGFAGRVVGTSPVRTVRSFTTVPFAQLFRFGENTTSGPEFVSAEALRAPLEVPAGRSRCTSLRFDALLDNVFPGATGTLTVSQAGRAPQTVTVVGGQVTPFTARLTPRRAFSIVPAIPAEGPERVNGFPDPVLRINGDGRCYSDERLSG